MPPATYDPLDDVVELLPTQIPSDVRRRLLKLTRELDKLAALDASGEVIIDRDAAARIAKDGDFFPPELHDRMQRETERHLGGKLNVRGTGRSVKWRELAEYGIPIRPTPLTHLRQLGINAAAPSNDVRYIIREHYPDLPEFWLDADAAQMRDTALRAIQHNRTVWECLVALLGFWSALAIIAVTGSVLILSAGAGPLGIALAMFLLAVLGEATSIIVLNCMRDPEFLG